MWNYRHSVSVEKAHKTMTVFLRRLEKALGGCPVACLAVLERRTSGCGAPGASLHWHFLAAAPPQFVSELLLHSRLIWKSNYGNPKIDQYDPTGWAAHYISKTAGDPGSDYQIHNLDRLNNVGPNDITTDLTQTAL